MAYAVGIDMIAIPRLRGALERHDGRFLRRVYTPLEVAFCRGRVAELVARLAAKEAVMKALGTGARGLVWLASRSWRPARAPRDAAMSLADRIGPFARRNALLAAGHSRREEAYLGQM